MKARMQTEGIDTATIKPQKCNSCRAYVELWEAPNIHSRIHARDSQGARGVPGGSQGVGEDGLAYYSLNFMQNIPMDSLGKKI